MHFSHESSHRAATVKNFLKSLFQLTDKVHLLPHRRISFCVSLFWLNPHCFQWKVWCNYLNQFWKIFDEFVMIIEWLTNGVSWRSCFSSETISVIRDQLLYKTVFVRLIFSFSWNIFDYLHLTKHQSLKTNTLLIVN